MPDIVEMDASSGAAATRMVPGEAGPRVSAPMAAGLGLTEGQAPAIYFVTHRAMGPADGWDAHFATAASLGFNAVLLETPFALHGDVSAPRSPPLVADHQMIDPQWGGGDALEVLATAARAAGQAGLALMIDIDILHLAADAALLAAHPDWFVNSASGASFRYLAANDATVDWWDGQIAAWQGAGIAGFRCLNAAAVPAPVWARLISEAKLRDPDARFMGWTIPAPAPAVAALADAGFDGCFSASCWWDFAGRWLNQDAATLAAVAPVIALATPPGIVDQPELARLRALGFAAAYAPGWLVEAGAQAGLEEQVRGLNELRAGQAELQAAPVGQVLSSEGAAIALVRRGDMIIAINASLEEPVAMDAASVLPALGVSTLRALAGDTIIGPADKIFLEHGGLELFNGTAGANVFLPVAVPLNTQVARIAIESITPQVDAGQFPVRRTVGESVTVEVDLIADGHDRLAGEILFRAADETVFRAVPLTLINNDRWTASFPLTRMGRHVYAISAWKDIYASFVDEVTKKHAAGVDIALELREGQMIVAEAAGGTAPACAALQALLGWLETADDDARREKLLSTEVIALMRDADVRKFHTTSHPILVDAERQAAGFASWYEIFPRSQAGDGITHGTFRDVIKQLPRVAAMGFDVLYFPPIHPIGRTNRKGKNNTLTPGPDDPGSPYAIGAAEGGHDALHPELGTLDDFRAMREAAAALSIELALDFAIQCAPDHPWLKDHPEWFDWRPDGSLRYAENPPKKYEDIVNVDFYAPGAQPSLWLALRDVVQFWVDQGVRLFRVDNPHTKPLPFWEWLIADIKSRHPDTVFLAEAFTRPKVMYRLAKIGFGQSYTYFTWRNTKAELTEYLTELATTAPREFFRPHFFVNTPDINPVFLQTNNRGAYLIRAALAATLSGLWGVYNGFELCEGTPVPGKEDYLNSEKYELKAWDYDRPGNIVAEITRLNQLRKANAALHSHLGIEFLPASNDQVLYFAKTAPDGNHLLVAISLDSVNVQEATIELPLWRFGLPDDGALAAEDLMRDYKFTWYGKYQTVRLNPTEQPFCIWRIG